MGRLPTPNIICSYVCSSGASISKYMIGVTYLTLLEPFPSLSKRAPEKFFPWKKLNVIKSYKFKSTLSLQW